MLDDFEGRGGGVRRWGASLAVSLVVYGGAGAGLVYASTAVRRAVVEDDLLEVELAPPRAEEPPPPPPPPPPVEAPPVDAPVARLGRPRPSIQVPTSIPDARPAESDRPLPPPSDPFAPEAEGDPNGVVGGVLGGVPGGQGSAPVAVAAAPPPPPVPAPRGPVRVVEGSTPPAVDREALVRNLEIPAALRAAGIPRVTVVVRVTIEEDGRVRRVEVLRGHPLLPDALVVAAVERTPFAPARLADGSAYAAIHTLPITVAITL